MSASRLACILDFSGWPGRLNSNTLSIPFFAALSSEEALANLLFKGWNLFRRR